MGYTLPHTYSGPQVLLSSKVPLEVDTQKQGGDEALGSQYVGGEVNMGQAWKGYTKPALHFAGKKLVNGLTQLDKG